MSEIHTFLMQLHFLKRKKIIGTHKKDIFFKKNIKKKLNKLKKIASHRSNRLFSWNIQNLPFFTNKLREFFLNDCFWII